MKGAGIFLHKYIAFSFFFILQRWPIGVIYWEQLSHKRNKPLVFDMASLRTSKALNSRWQLGKKIYIGYHYFPPFLYILELDSVISSTCLNLNSKRVCKSCRSQQPPALKGNLILILLTFTQMTFLTYNGGAHYLLSDPELFSTCVQI